MQNVLNKFKSYLCLPGDGVYTVHTGKDKKENYQLKTFGVIGDDAKRLWEKNFDLLNKENKIFLFGVTCDTGGGIQRGANWGPLFIREHWSSKYTHDDLTDLGDVRTIPHLLHDKYLNETTLKSCRSALYQDENSDLPISPLSIAEDFATEFFTNFPTKKLLSLGGDHSVSHPLVLSWLKARKEQNKKVAIIHFDAHTDLMSERLGIDICFGTWAYHTLPLLKDPKDLIQVGVRSSGKERSHWESHLGINQIWAKEVKDKGVTSIFNEIKNYLQDNYDELYISFDIDALDEKFAGATGTPEAGGLDLYEAITLIRLLGENFNIGACDIVEVAPFVRQNLSSKTNEPFQTLESASLIMNAMLEAMK